MSRSEIFNNYVKIAQDKEILSESDKAAKELQKTRRMDSLSIEAIEKLYNLKPETAKGGEYKNNILESAHPNSVVVAPAYDKLNGLVENNIERQNILLHIVNKPVNGLLIQRKYAKKDLILSLVRTANELDNQNQDQLRALADSCLLTLKKQANPALLGLGPLGWAGLAASAIGLYYLSGQLPASDQGFEMNHDRLIEELTDIYNKEVNFVGWGFELTQEGKKDIQNIINMLNAFKSEYDQVKPLLAFAVESHSMQEMAQKANENPEKFRLLDKAYKKILKAIQNIEPSLLLLLKKFTNPELISLYIAKKGKTTSSVESVGAYGDSPWALVPGEFRDVKELIKPYLDSLKNILKAVEASKQAVTRSQQYLEDWQRQQSEPFAIDNDTESLADALRRLSPGTNVSQYSGLSGQPSTPLAATPGSTLPQYSGMSQAPAAPAAPAATSPSTTTSQYGGMQQPSSNHPSFGDLKSFFSQVSPSTTIRSFE